MDNQLRWDGSAPKPKRMTKPNEYGKRQAAILKATCDVMNAHNIPPLGEMVKDVVASQIRRLLKGGWPDHEVRVQLIALALEYDRFTGHSRMTHLQEVVERGDEDRDERAHRDRMRSDQSNAVQAMIAVQSQGVSVPGLDATLARNDSAYRRPTGHAWQPKDDDRTTCVVCGGPYGVHQ